MGLDDEQKRFLWIAVGGVIAFLVVMILFRQNNNASATSGASPSPPSSSSSPSYVPTTDYTYTQDSYNQGPAPTPTSAPPTPGPTPAPTPPTPPPAQIGQPVRRPPVPVPTPTPAQYVTVGTWQNGNPPWNSYLSGIAAHEGESLSYLESLNPQISNPNLIYPGQRVEVRPGVGSAFPMASASDRGYAPVDNLALAPMPY